MFGVTLFHTVFIILSKFNQRYQQAITLIWLPYTVSWPVKAFHPFTVTSLTSITAIITWRFETFIHKFGKCCIIFTVALVAENYILWVKTRPAGNGQSLIIFTVSFKIYTSIQCTNIKKKVKQKSTNPCSKGAKFII